MDIIDSGRLVDLATALSKVAIERSIPWEKPDPMIFITAGIKSLPMQVRITEPVVLTLYNVPDDLPDDEVFDMVFDTASIVKSKEYNFQNREDRVSSRTLRRVLHNEGDLVDLECLIVFDSMDNESPVAITQRPKDNGALDMIMENSQYPKVLLSLWKTDLAYSDYMAIYPQELIARPFLLLARDLTDKKAIYVAGLDK